MSKIIGSFIFLMIVNSISAQPPVKVMDFNQLEKHITKKNNTVYIVNFWATWCQPCIEELPDFLKLNEQFKNKNFKLILVSLDFSNQIKKRVEPFLKKHNITSEVIVLDDLDANTWINKVDPSWDGAIPVTLLLQNGKKTFHNGTINYTELYNLVQPKIK